MGAPVALHARAHTDVGNTGQLPAFQFHADQVHAIERNPATLELHVGGRSAQLTAKLLPVQHPAGNGERAPQQAFGKGEITFGQRLADAGAADPQAIQLHRGRGFDAEAFRCTGLLQEFEITGAIATEAEIVTDFQMPGPQPLDQDRMDELGSAEFPQAAVERQAKHPVHTLTSQQLELVAQTGQTYRCGIRAEELARLRLEYHHAGGQTKLSRTLAQPLENGLMAAVHAVEIADGGDTAPMLGSQVVEALNQLHSTSLVHKVVDYTHSRRWTTGAISPPARQVAMRRGSANHTARRAKSRSLKPSTASMPK
ncbi:hypothetical protein D9M72_183870 [compost metagenome]